MADRSELDCKDVSMQNAKSQIVTRYVSFQFVDGLCFPTPLLCLGDIESVVDVHVTQLQSAKAEGVDYHPFAIMAAVEGEHWNHGDSVNEEDYAGSK